MREGGAVLIVIGVVVSIASFFLTTTVDTPADLTGMSSQVFNSGLLQRQMMVLHVGLAIGISGTLLFAASELAARRPPIDHQVQPAPRTAVEQPGATTPSPPATPATPASPAASAVPVDDDENGKTGRLLVAVLFLPAVVVLLAVMAMLTAS